MINRAGEGCRVDVQGREERSALATRGRRRAACGNTKALRVETPRQALRVEKPRQCAARPQCRAPLSLGLRFVSPSPTLSPTDPAPRGLLTLCPGASSGPLCQCMYVCIFNIYIYAFTAPCLRVGASVSVGALLVLFASVSVRALLFLFLFLPLSRPPPGETGNWRTAFWLGGGCEGGRLSESRRA